jgi:hypothetical protein
MFDLGPCLEFDALIYDCSTELNALLYEFDGYGSTTTGWLKSESGSGDARTVFYVKDNWQVTVWSNQAGSCRVMVIDYSRPVPDSG